MDCMLKPMGLDTSKEVDTENENASHYRVREKVYAYPNGHTKSSWRKQAREHRKWLESKGYTIFDD